MLNNILQKSINPINKAVIEKPTPNELMYGEIVIDYTENNEKIYLKNDSGNIVELQLTTNPQDILNELNQHISENNPHNITKDKIGLENVDNTSDLNKPISIPQQNELDTKLNKTAIADNLTTNASNVALSAAQGIILNNKIKQITGSQSQNLSSLIARVVSLEEEVDGTEQQADLIIKKEDSMINEFSI